MITANIIGYDTSAKGSESLQAVNPDTRLPLEGAFTCATPEEVNEAAQKAFHAWQTYRHTDRLEKANFLRTIADEIEALGDTLVERVMQESGLPQGRVVGERGRTCNQLRLFADVVAEGSWVNAIIDRAMPDRQPMPRADIRNMLQAIGPVVVFTASNFPLAFSTAGGDTASALASGCPVIVKAHPSHPGTNALVSEAIQRAANACGMPDGVFSSLQDKGYEVGTALVQHPRVKAVGFTGSHGGGMALYRAAAQREEPIPVFAEMGSTNPVFLLPEAIRERAEQLSTQIAGSVNMGAGQFCTNPGLLVLQEDDTTPAFLQQLGEAFEQLSPTTMLNQSIHQNYQQGRERCLNMNGVEGLAVLSNGSTEHWKAYPAVATVTASDFLANPGLQEEVFGPFSLVIRCQGREEVVAVAASMRGQLTASLMHGKEEVSAWQDLMGTLEQRVGRLIFNGVPTGVEVGHAMQHGGPYPAASDSRFTSVGTGAIRRFVRPVAYQDCPNELLPDALKDENPQGIRRFVNGRWE